MGLATFLEQLNPGLKDRLKKVACLIPPRLRQPPIYWRWRWFLDRAQHWDAARIEAWQLDQLRALVRHAYESTAGYRELYRKAGVTPDDIRTRADVARLPFTTKEMFRDHLDAFTARRGPTRYVTTGGSTGIPFGFYESPATRHVEQAFMHAGWTWAGWTLGQRSAVLRGAFVGTPENWSRADAYARELALSSYYLTADTVEAYLARMAEHRAAILQAYPSSLNLLCDLIKEKGLHGRFHPELILLGSENVYDWQMEKFQATFPHTRIFAWYGSAEKAALAPWCEHARHYHAWPFYGLTEVVGPRDQAVAEGEEGEIVGTSFLQTTTPFIRYRTLDRAVRGPGTCPACGRHFPILARVTGRAHEVIVTRAGRYISMTAINMHDDLFDALKQFQFRQDEPGRVVFHYVPRGPALPEPEAARIRHGLGTKLGPDVELRLEPVPDIPRTKSGKYRFLVQTLPIQYGDRE